MKRFLLLLLAFVAAFAGAPPGHVSHVTHPAVSGGSLPILDCFDDTATTLLSSHTSDSGDTWSHSAYSGYSAGLVRVNPSGEVGPTASTTTRYYINSSSNTDVEVLTGLKILSATNSQAGPCLRIADDTANTYYWLLYSQASGSWSWQSKTANTAHTVAGSYSDATSPGDTRVARFRISGTSLTGYINGTSRLTATDSAISSAGVVGIMTNGDTGHSSTTGIHVDYTIVRGTAAGSALVPFGPASAPNLVASTYRVIADGAVTGTVVVTPTDGGAGGSFSPSTYSLSETNPVAEFTYTPATAGPTTLTFTGDNAWTVDKSITVVDPPQATSYTITGPSSGELSAASTNFTVTVNGLYTGTISPASTGTGTFSPTSLTFTSSGVSEAHTFTYTPTAIGVNPHVISATNSGSLTNVSTANYTVTVSGESIALTSPVPYQTVMDRYTTTPAAGYGLVPVTGTLSGGTGRTLEARFNGGTWRTIATGVSGAFSGYLRIPPGQGLFEIRDAGATTVTNQTAYVGCGLVIETVGQSNMSGRGTTSQTYTTTYTGSLKATIFGNSYGYAELTDPYDTSTNQVDTVSSDSSSGSYAVLLAGALQQRLGVPVMLVPAPLGGTTTTQWLPSPTATLRTTLFGSAVNRAQTVGGVNLVIWHQGETNLTSGMSEAQSLADLTAIGSAFNAATGAKFMPCQLQAITSGSANPTNTLSYNTNVIAQVWGLPGFAQGPNLYDITVTVDGLHIVTNANLLTAANRWETSIEQALAVSSGAGNRGNGGIGFGLIATVNYAFAQ